MLQRRGHALQHVAIQLCVHAREVDLGLLAGFVGDLAHHPLQALNLARERHHQGAHQALLHFGVDAPLLQQQGLAVVNHLVHGQVQGRQVTDGLGQRAGQLLHPRITVHFQRIEVIGVAIFARALFGTQATRLDLGIGFTVHLPQLIADTINGGGHFIQLILNRAVLLLQPRTEDRNLAGLVQHPVQAFHRHTRGFTAQR